MCLVSGPSGSGKTTLCRGLSESDANCVYAVSATTRAMRPGEVDGRDYHFLAREDFEKRALRGDFLEWAEVHGNLYGTLKSAVLKHIEAGRDVLMDIDVQGAALIRKASDPAIRESIVDIFILVPDRGELRKRLGGRGTESPEELELRLTNALAEMERWREYTYTLVSASPEADRERFRAILAGERCRTSRLGDGPRSPAEAELDLFTSTTLS